MCNEPSPHTGRLPLRRSSRWGSGHWGFTLVELLVVIAIIGTLVALLLPAVQAAREAARRAQCTNNLKQFGLGLQNYHSAREEFPVAAIRKAYQGGKVILPYSDGTAGHKSGCQSWIVQLLPYMEQQGIYDLIDFDEWIPLGTMVNKGPRNSQVIGLELPSVTCPSDNRDAQTKLEFAPTNYVACAGKEGTTTPWHMVLREPNTRAITDSGLFINVNPRSIREVTDGLSHTMAVSECLVNRPWVKRYGSWNVEAAVNGTAPDITKDETSTPRGMSWYYGVAQQTWSFSGRVPPNDPVMSNHEPEGGTHYGFFAARSGHPGIVNVTMADGSVNTVADNIDILVWRGRSSIAGEETF